MDFEIVKVEKLPWWKGGRFEVTLRDEDGKLHKVRVLGWATETFMLIDIESELKKKLGIAEPKPDLTKELLNKKITIKKEES